MAMTPEEFMARLNKIKKYIRSREFLTEVAELARTIVVKRTRLGYGASEGINDKFPLKPLSPGYVKHRKNRRPTGPSTPTKSNLTYTGDMLNAVEYKIQQLKITIGIFDPQEAEKAFWNLLNDREFLALTLAEKKQIANFIRKKIADMLKGK